jgi:hypothetical protein
MSAPTRGRLKATEIIGAGGPLMTDYELAELVGRIGNLYTKKGLSPPFALRDAVKHWVGPHV